VDPKQVWVAGYEYGKSRNPGDPAQLVMRGRNGVTELVPRISQTPWLQGYFFVVLKKFAPAASPVEVPQSSVVFATHEVADRLVRFSTPPETSLHMSSPTWRAVLGQARLPHLLGS